MSTANQALRRRAARAQATITGSEPERVPVRSRPRAAPQPNTPQRKKSDFLLGPRGTHIRHRVEDAAAKIALGSRNQVAVEMSVDEVVGGVPARLVDIHPTQV